MNRDNPMEEEIEGLKAALREEEIIRLKAALRSLAEEARAQAGPHLEVEQLAAYHFREISDDEAERIQDHLVVCRDCASQLLDLAEFCDPAEPESSRSSQSESEAAWARLQPLFRAAPQTTPSLFQRLRKRIFPFRPAYALAALSLVLSLALVAWVISLNRENQTLIARLNQEQSDSDAEAAKKLEETQRQTKETRAQVEQLKTELDQTRREKDELKNELTKPQLNPSVAALPLSGPRSAGDPPPSIELKAGGSFFFMLDIPDPPEPHYRSYAIEVFDRRGALVVAEKGLIRDRKGGLTILLPRHLFPPGKYRFKVYGLGRGGRTLVIENVVPIRHEQRG